MTSGAAKSERVGTASVTVRDGVILGRGQKAGLGRFGPRGLFTLFFCSFLFLFCFSYFFYNFCNKASMTSNQLLKFSKIQINLFKE
jgi:hypothetical protein